MAQTVVGFFDSHKQAQSAVEKLQNLGISRDQIDLSAGRGTTSDASYSDDSDRGNESGITRFFKSLFGDDDSEADRYSRVASSSEAIVTVHAQSDAEAQRAADLLDEFGAVDVDERSTNYGAVSNDRIGEVTEREASIPVIREDLEVGKRTVETGGVRVRSRIVERPVEEHVRLRQENVRVERESVDRPVQSGEFDTFREGEIELTERAEVPVVNKEARVVEEVRISKDVEERSETIRDTVRNTEVDVDRIDSDDDVNRINRNNTL